MKLGILISGRGSNMKALAAACSAEDYPAKVACVISNNKNAAGLDAARQKGLPTFVVENKPLDVSKIDRLLRDNQVDLVCLAGFMSILPADFLKLWPNKVINIHPSLLPSFKGLNAQSQAIAAGVKIAGCTVHYVYPEVDSGPIIMQAAVPVFPNDDVETLSAVILAMEHRIYSQAVRLIASGKLTVDGQIIKASALGSCGQIVGM